MDNITKVENTLYALLEGMLDPNSLPMVVSSQIGQIAGVNRAFERVFGYDGKNLYDKPIETLIPARYMEDHRRAFNRVRCNLNSSQYIGHALLAHIICADGKEKPVSIALDVITLRRSICFVATFSVVKE